MPILTLCFGLTALGNPAPSLADDLLRAAPQESVIALTIRDVDGLRTRASENAWGRFFDDPQMHELCGYLETKGVSWAKMLEETELPIDPLSFAASIHDSLTFFVAPVGEALEPSFGFLISPGEDRGAFEEHYDQILELMSGDFVTSVEAYEGVDLTLYESEDSDEPDLVTFETGGCVGLLGASDRESSLVLAHGVLDRFAGREESGGFAQSSSLSDARTSVRGQKSIEFLLDPAALIKLIGANEDDPDFGEVQGVLAEIGIAQMRYVYMNADIGSGENLDLNYSMEVPPGTYLAKYLDFLGPQPRELGSYLPADATSIMLASYDLYGAWEATLEILQEKQPEAFEQIQSGLAGLAASMNLDIEQDLLAELSGTIASFTMVVPVEEIEAAMGGLATMGLEFEGIDQGNATIIGLEEPEVVELFLEDVLDKVGVFGSIEQEDFQGQLVNSINVPGAMSIYWTFTDDALVMSEYPTALRAALRLVGQEDAVTALDSDPFKARLAGRSDSSMIGVNDTAQTMRMLLGVGGMFTGLFGAMDPDMPDLSDMPLPKPEVAMKYFKGTLLSTVDRTKTSLVWSLAGR